MIKFGNFVSLLAIMASALIIAASAQEYKSGLMDPLWFTPLNEGDSVPNVTFKTRVRIDSEDVNPFDWLDRTSEDYFKGKRVVLFVLPGEFNPTCSTSHLPGYEEAYDEILALDIDEVYCLSVNDAFVMRQWGLAQG